MKTELILNSNGVIISSDELQLNGQSINGILFGSQPVAEQIDANDKFAFESNLELLSESWLNKYNVIKEVLNEQVKDTPKKYRYLPYSDLNLLILLRGQKIEERDLLKAKEMNLAIMNLTDARCKVPFMFLEGLKAEFSADKPDAIKNVKSRTQINYWVNAATMSHQLNDDELTKLFNAGATGINDLSEIYTGVYNHKDNKDKSDKEKLNLGVEKIKAKKQKKNTKGNNTESNLVANIDGLATDNNQLSDQKQKRSLDVKHRERELCLAFIDAFIKESNAKNPLKVNLSTFKTWVELNVLND